MFGFGGKKPAVAARPKAGQSGSKQRDLSQFGFLDLGNVGDDGLMDKDDDDMSLEAELAALTRGDGGKVRQKKKAPKVVSPEELDAMISSSLKDIPSDGEVSDIDDAEVEGELNDLCGGSEEDETEPTPVQNNKAPKSDQVSLISERLKMYEEAEKNADSSGDKMKARRFGRGVKTLNDLLKQAKSGKMINVDDVPPVLAVSSLKPQIPGPVSQAAPAISQPTPVETMAVDPEETANVQQPVSRETDFLPAPMKPTVGPKPVAVPPQVAPQTVLEPEVAAAVARRNEFKRSALQAKNAGDKTTALQFVQLVKICDQLISAAQQGGPVDWSLLPPLPGNTSVASIEPKRIESATEVAVPNKEEQLPAAAQVIEPMKTEEASVPPPMEVPPQPRTALEALQQRLAKYKSSMEQAQGENNSSKVRRMGRIVKQYEDAIKGHKAGRPIPYDELPTPPGFPPIPGAPQQTAETSETVVEPSSIGSLPPMVPAVPPQVTAPAAPPAAAPNPVVSPPKVPEKKTALATRQDRQLAMLVKRQTLFKQAALEAKKSGELEQAKEYLRMAKGIDPLIKANQCGVPVDMDTLPIPPQMKMSSAVSAASKSNAAGSEGFDIISSEECALVPSLEQNTSLLAQLEADLLAQMKMCVDNRDHYKLMGDIANSNRFDQLALYTRKDLDVVRSAASRGETPRWKNEMRTFSIVKCCTDLKDDDMEITIVRGLSFNVQNPKTIDTYVKFELPLPNSDNPTKDKTSTVKDTNNPEYNQTFLVNISRQSRTLLRVFKGKNVKFEVWAKGGFLRSDSPIGTATVKLADLLGRCVVHQAVDLMDGRKTVGGKLEVKIRIRDPIVGKEVEQVHSKWTLLIP